MSDQPKVLMVTREFASDRRYGLGKTVSAVMEELKRSGVNAIYLTQDDAGVRGRRMLRRAHSSICRAVGWMFRDTDLSTLSWFLFERINMGRLAAKFAQAESVDYVHCHDPIIAAGYLFFVRPSTRKRARVGVTQHGFGSYTQAFHEDGVPLTPAVMRWLRGWERRILARLDWVHVPTHCGLEQLARDLCQYPVPSHWRVILHPRPELAVRDRQVSRQRLQWAPNTLYIIAVGRFVQLKRLSSLIDSCANLSGCDWNLVLVGEGDTDSLRATAESLGIADRLHFAVTDDVSHYYFAADIYVSVSATESFGLANLEAVTAGVPSVCTAVGGTPEVLGSGAWLVPAGNPAAVTSVLQSLADDDELRCFWSQQATAWTRAWPGRKEIAAAYLDMYRGEQPPSSLAYRPPLSRHSLFSEWRATTASWPVCPLPAQLSLPKKGKALVLSPHHDDETLGCGGTLARLRLAGWQVKLVVVTDGAQGDPSGYLNGGDVVKHRQGETRAAAGHLGVEDILFWAQPDGHFFPDPALSERFSILLDEFAPDWLLVPPILDFHRDHVNTSLMATERWHARGCRERLFYYEIWQPLPANWLVDVTPVLELKRRAISEYRLPMRYQDYSAAFEGLMRYRGLYMGPNAGSHAEMLLEVDAKSWRTVATSLMRLRESQFRTEK